MQNGKKGIDNSVFQGLVMGFDIPEEKEIKVESKMLDEDTQIINVEDYIDETEEELREKQEKALEEFKQGFKGELTAELEEQITNKIKEELKIERQKFEEEKERLREEELQRVYRESLNLEDETVKSKLEIVDNEPEVSEKKQKKSKKQSIQQEMINPNPSTQIYIGQRDGIEIQRKKVSLLRRLGVKIKDFIFLLLSLQFVLFIGIVLTDLVNPSLELDIIKTFIQINITVFTLIKGVLQDIWGFIEERYLQK